MKHLIALLAATLLVLCGCETVKHWGKNDTSLQLTESAAYAAAGQVIDRALSPEDKTDKAKLILVAATAVQVTDPHTTAAEFRARVIRALADARAGIGYEGELPEHWGELAAVAWSVFQDNKGVVGDADAQAELDRATALLSAIARGFERRARETIR
jgi:hypothetical protein